MKFFSWGNGPQVVLALDIGTEVVKALVLRIEENEGRGVIIGVGKVAQKPGNMRSGAVADINGVIESSRQAIGIATEKAQVKKIGKSIIGIAGELVRGTTTTVHYSRVNTNLEIGSSELKMIIRKVQEKAFERIKKQLAWETGQGNIEVNLNNAARVSVSIDGYQIKNPTNFHMKRGLDEYICSSIAAEPYAVARSVEVNDMNDFSAIFIDIGGDKRYRRYAMVD
jgi:cell division ATPase FtsA